MNDARTGRKSGGVGRLFVSIAAGSVLVWGWLTVPSAVEHRCPDCLLGHDHPIVKPLRFSLKNFASAQADFRENDRDGNGVRDFWRGDISGLHGVLPPGSTEMIRLIGIGGAGADAAPTGNLAPGSRGLGAVHRNRYADSAPVGGFWYRALRHADEAPGALDSRRFAACAYPDDYRSGRRTLIIDERNTIYARDLGRPGSPDVFPDDATLKRDWKKLD